MSTLTPVRVTFTLADESHWAVVHPYTQQESDDLMAELLDAVATDNYAAIGHMQCRFIAELVEEWSLPTPATYAELTTLPLPLVYAILAALTYALIHYSTDTRSTSPKDHS